MTLDENNRDHATSFGRSLPLESALTELYGERRGRKPGRWANSATSFKDPGNARKAIKEACTRIRKVLNDLTTADERFLHITDVTLTEIESTANMLGKRDAAAVDCIGHLIKLIAHLVGYDPLSNGRITRHVIYFQTIEQKLSDDRNKSPASQVNSISEHMTKFICSLYADGTKVPLIARVLNRSESLVKDVLVRKGHLERPSTLRKRSNSTSRANP